MMEQRYDGPRLGVILAEQGRTQRWLAGRVGVSESLVSHIISGRRTLTPALAEKIAVLLGLPVVFLSRELPNGSETDSSVERAA